MPTLSPPPQTQSAAEHPATGDAPGASLVAIVHKQLAALESLAAEGRADATLLHTEITELSTRLSATTARLARLEGTLASTERVLVAIRTGLLAIPAQPPEMAQPSTPQPTAHGAESRLAVPTPVAPTLAPQPNQSRTEPGPQPGQLRAAPALASPEVTPVARVAPLDAPASRGEQVAASTTQAQHEPERSAASIPPAATPAAPSQATNAPVSAVPTPQPEPQALEQIAPAEPATGPRIQRGSTVEVLFDDNTTETYTIVRQSEANRSRNLIGENTPLGQALLGARVGDICRYRVANNPETTVRVGAIA